MLGVTCWSKVYFKGARKDEAGPGTLHRDLALQREKGVPELVRRLRAVLDGLPGGPHEMVFVDDGSTDRTFELLDEAAAGDPRIVVVSLSRNFGHQTAISAALDHATGDVVVVMDGDLQDPPEAIPQFLDE